jgi:hypothetical protein
VALRGYPVVGEYTVKYVGGGKKETQAGMKQRLVAEIAEGTMLITIGGKCYAGCKTLYSLFLSPFHTVLNQAR